MDTTTKVLLLVSVGIILRKYYKNWQSFKAKEAKLTWPLKIPPCPDYWIKDKNGKCKNMFNMGECPKRNGSKGNVKVSQGEIDFGTDFYSGKSGNINKCRWAQRCKNSWEGVDKLCA